jgi:hypothetical protein
MSLENPGQNLENPANESPETPLERAARLETEAETAQAPTRDKGLVDDIDRYVARTDPEHLSDAEAELARWQTPDDPMSNMGDARAASDGAVVNVFSAYSEPEANIVKGVLDAAGIPSSLDNLGGAVMGGIFSAGEQVWADIVVPAAYADAARQAIADAATENLDVDTDNSTTAATAD